MNLEDPRRPSEETYFYDGETGYHYAFARTEAGVYAIVRVCSHTDAWSQVTWDDSTPRERKIMQLLRLLTPLPGPQPGAIVMLRPQFHSFTIAGLN